MPAAGRPPCRPCWVAAGPQNPSPFRGGALGGVLRTGVGPATADTRDNSACAGSVAIPLQPAAPGHGQSCCPYPRWRALPLPPPQLPLPAAGPGSIRGRQLSRARGGDATSQWGRAAWSRPSGLWGAWTNEGAACGRVRGSICFGLLCFRQQGKLMKQLELIGC